jgi:integrase
VTHRIAGVAKAAGIKTNIRELRHYNATQLVSNGVDLRTAAGRLGHSGGGAITMKVYAHRTRTSDRKAAQVITGGLVRLSDVSGVAPQTSKPIAEILPAPAGPRDGDAPYRSIAADIRAAIDSGVLTAGDLLPSVVEARRLVQRCPRDRPAGGTATR